jgi:hypothetical protein
MLRQILLCGAWLLPVPASAGLSSLVPAHLMAERADVIVAGTLQAVARVGDGARLQVLVARSVKGDVSAGTVVYCEYAGTPDALRRVEGNRVLLFLQKGAGDSAHAISLMEGAEPLPTIVSYPAFDSSALTSESVAPKYSNTDTILDKLYRELAWAGARGDRDALSCLVQSVAISRTKPRVTREVAEQLAAYPAPIPRAAGFKLLLTLGDPDALARIAAEEESLFLSGEGGSVSLAIQNFYPKRDASAVESLGRLMANARHRELKLACALALARIHSLPALPILAGLLDSDDAALVAYGVGGLAMFANNVVDGYTPAAGEWAYRSDETIAHSVMDEKIVTERRSYYVDFWKAWWSEHRNQLAPGL